jgi:adenylosuccinate synthase
MKGICVVGLGFGDEGKGATVDFLCRRHKHPVVIRYSGGSQSSHTVVSPEGLTHRFHQVGSGAFANAPTYMTRDMMINPVELKKEMEILRDLCYKKPDIQIHPQALVTTYLHVIMGRWREKRQLGHGSTGQGVGETRNYYLQHGQDALVFEDLYSMDTVLDKLVLLQHRMVTDAYEHDFPMEAHQELKSANARTLSHQLHELSSYFGSRVMSPGPGFADMSTLIFEGTQGVLLDEYQGIYPNTCWNRTTAEPAEQLWEGWRRQDGPLSVIGVTRSYATRHGSGPFLTHDETLSALLDDPNNPDNEFQGHLRRGWLDLVMLQLATTSIGAKLTAVAVNHLDQFAKLEKPQVCKKYDKTPANTISLAEPFVMNINPIHSIEAGRRVKWLLNGCRPVLESTDEANLLSLIADIVGVPVSVIGRGPAATDRQELVSL